MLLQKGLILCEGETEQRYFREMEAHLVLRQKLNSVTLEVYQPKDHSPKGLMAEAKKRISKAKEAEEPEFDFIWLVFDKDDHPGIANTYHDVLVWKGNTPIRIALSSICFEYYILLHFERTTRPFRNCAQAVKQLKKYLPDYEKSDNLYKELFKRKYEAYTNCEFVMKQLQNDLLRGLMPYELAAYTNVHELEYFLEAL